MTSPGPGQTSTPQTDDDEVARLRAQVAELTARLNDTQPLVLQAEPAGRSGWWRPWVVGVLLVLVGLIAPASVVATWAHDEVSNTDRYVQTVSPLAADPAVQNAIINRITTEVVSRLNVTALTQQAADALAAQGLPPRVTQSISALATPLANGVRNYINQRVARFVRSPAFAQAWDNANRQAHIQLVAVLTGEGTDTVTVTNNAVSINLATVINAVKAQLVHAGFGLAANLPTVNAQFTVFKSADLGKAQKGFRWLKGAARVLPILGLILLALAVYVARDRRRALMVGGLAIAAGMLLLGLSLNVFRQVYLNAIPADQLPPKAAGNIYDTLTHFIRLNLRAVLVVALAVALGAWLAGSSASATATRRGLARGFAAIRGGGEHLGIQTGPVGRFVHAYLTALRGVVIGVALLVYVQAAHPTGAWTIKVLAVMVAVLLVLELVARPPAAGPAGTIESPPSSNPPAPA